jgi:hypothetical protein
MMTNILRFSPSAPEERDWRNDELAELYRVEHSLVQAGISVSTVRGVSDEGDPWFAFCDADDDVIVHIARYDGVYHLYAKALREALQGLSFTDVTKKFISRLPMQMAKGVTLHPSALFGLMVATLFFAVDHKSAHAAEKAAYRAHSQSLVDTLRQYVRVVADKSGEKTFSSESELEAMTQLIVVAATMEAQAHTNLLVTGAPEGAPVKTYEFTWLGSTPAQAAASQLKPLQSADIAAEAPAGQGTYAPSNDVAKAAPPDAITLSAQVTPANGADPAPRPISSGIRSLSPIAGAYVLPRPEGADGSTLIQKSGTTALTENLTSGDVRILVAKDVHVLLDLSLIYAKGANTGHAALVLNGHASLDLNELTVTSAHEVTGSSGSPGPSERAMSSAPHLDLQVASVGAASNTITIGSGAAVGVDVALQITGHQDLNFNERASNLRNVSVDSTQFQGALTIGIDLSDVNDGATLISRSTFAVDANSSFAFLHVNNTEAVQVGISLASAIVNMNPGAGSLVLRLIATDVTAVGVSVISFSAPAVTNLTIESLGGGQKANSLGTVYDIALDNLAITGDAPLAIEAFVMFAGGGQQPVIVDASHFGADLRIDLTGLASSLNGPAGLTIRLGAADSQVTDFNTSTPLTIVGSGKSDTINLGSGGTHTVVRNLTSSDHIFVGGGMTTDIVIDATHQDNASHAAFNALTLMGAAQAAATAVGNIAPHQAVLFNYGSNSFVFIDALGNHKFNSTVDAIVGLTGMHTATELTGQFHSV